MHYNTCIGQATVHYVYNNVMATSAYENAFHISGPLCGESTADRRHKEHVVQNPDAFYVLSLSKFFGWTDDLPAMNALTHWGRVTSVNQAIISSDNGLSPGRRQATIWSGAGIM